MNRRDFLLAACTIPASIVMLKFTNRLHATPVIQEDVILNSTESCMDCLPMQLSNSVKTPYTPPPGECDDSPFPCGEADPNPTGIALKSFYAEPVSFMEFIRGLFK